MNTPPKEMLQKEQMGRVQDRFTRTATAFADYVLRERGFEAEHLLRMVAPRGTELAADVCCGPGTLARYFAPHVRRIAGFDLTPAMLERARKEAEAMQLRNFIPIRGNALAMPFRDGAFDLMVTSYSMHHLPDAAAAVREIARVMKRGGVFGLLDMIASEDPRRAKLANDIEIARDSSHSRTLPASEFEALLLGSGFRIRASEKERHSRSFDQWMRTAGWKRGDAAYEATRRLMESAVPSDGAGLLAKFLDPPADGAPDSRLEIEFQHEALFAVAEKQ